MVVRKCLDSGISKRASSLEAFVASDLPVRSYGKTDWMCHMRDRSTDIHTVCLGPPSARSARTEAELRYLVTSNSTVRVISNQSLWQGIKFTLKIVYR